MTNTQWKKLLTQPVAGDHIVQAYQDEEFLIDAVSRFVCAGLQQREGIVVIARKSHWGVIEGRLERDGFNVGDAIRRGQLKNLDADDALATFMKGGTPNRHAFMRQMGSVLDDIQCQFRTVRAYSEMVDILWQEGRHEVADALEECWNSLLDLDTFSLLCAYRLDPHDAEVQGGLQRVCKTHSHLIMPNYCAASEEVLARVTATTD